MRESLGNAKMKESKSSQGSLILMNPVASGDNMATGLSGHKSKDEILETPTLIPCCEGKELQINQELVHIGLSAISVKHETACNINVPAAPTSLPGIVKHRNSFRCLHRPDLKRVPYLRCMKPDELESLFQGYAEIPMNNSYSGLPDRAPKPLNPIKSRCEAKVENIDDDALHPTLTEKPGGIEDVPEGMRLHGTRAKLYTSVLAGITGDHVEDTPDIQIPDSMIEPTVEDESQPEELQIIFPPRDDASVNTQSNDVFEMEKALVGKQS